ncbi:DUF167 family protein [Telmatospirillum sp.]|uniref:DUF167 domain-containing protein n=1 Tax=Telmatospirillum sp. TaxID=2079197 RepID=UPI0028484D59|nr:DUF167 family protein [Telmatospirillum sp.]MDR3438705.1 DUF167 family protein [Telmatospirillum sp.]
MVCDRPIADGPPESPLTVVAGGCRLAVKLTPKASRNRIEGVAVEADGGGILKVSVTAVPEDGKANKALIDLLAKSWKIAKRSISIVAGATDRRKVLFIENDADDMRRLLNDCVRTR